MVKAQNLIAMLASETGFDFDEVGLKARRLREADLFVRETRSPNSPRVTHRHAANLLTMLLSGAPANHAQQTIERAERLRLGHEDLKHTQQSESKRTDVAVFKLEQASFIDVVETLISEASKDPEKFEHEYKYTYIKFSEIAFEATVYINIKEGRILGGKNVMDAIVTYFDVKNIKALSKPENFNRYTEIKVNIIGQIGRLFARVQ